VVLRGNSVNHGEAVFTVYRLYLIEREFREETGKAGKKINLAEAGVSVGGAIARKPIILAHGSGCSASISMQARILA
jgi:hypothetical protein